MAAWWRPTRHFTSQAHTSVAASATRKTGSEKLATKSGAWRSTLAAGCLGKPVCMATQMTQMMMPPPVKKSSVNQSISAATLRWRVGNANAARVAREGRASIRARSAGLVVSVVKTATAANHSGSARCRLTLRLNICRRQRHTVHSTSGQAGQVNHSSRRSNERHSLPAASCGIRMRQRHRSNADARAAESTVTRAIMPAARNAPRLPPLAGSGPRRCSRALPVPRATAMLGAALSARPAMPAINPKVGAMVRYPIAAAA